MTPLLFIDTRTLLVRRVVNRCVGPLLRISPGTTPADLENFRRHGQAEAEPPARADCGHQRPPPYGHD